MHRSRVIGMIPWVVLVVSLAAAVALWVIATRPVTGTAGRVFGGGTGNFSPSMTNTNWFLAGLALCVALAGLLVWAWLLLKRRRDAAARVMVVTITIVMLAAGWAIVARLRAGHPLEAVGPHFGSIAEVVERLDGSRVECRSMTMEDAPMRYMKPHRGVCEIARRLALDDGLETVTIHMWRSREARARWYEDQSADDAVSVEGPTWLIECEFETTCAQIQRLIGGRTH